MIAAITSACAGGQESVDDSDGLVGVEVVQAEFDKEAEKLVLPDGESWPASPYDSKSKTRYQRGDGATSADGIWECRWVREYLSAHTERPRRAQAAMDQLELTSTLPLWEALDQTGKEFSRDNLRKARLGDPSGYQEFALANCQ